MRNRLRRYAPIFTLLVLAPFVGEVLFGVTPLSRLPFFLAQVGMYGGGALMIREIVRRRGLSSWWLVSLGIAYGIVEEGLVLQSLFNPHFPGLDILGSYGRAGGVNWVWAEFILGYHAIFSITIPVVLTELMFPGRSAKPWLARRGWLAVLALFLGNCFFLAVFLNGWSGSKQTPTPRWLLITSAVVVGAIVGSALRAKSAAVAETASGRPSASALRLRLIGLLGALGWFGVRIFVVGDGHQMPAAVALLAWPAVALLVSLSVQRWSVRGQQWPPFDVYTITAGALPISWLFGVLIVAVSSRVPIVDLVGHLLFGLAAIFALRAVRKSCRPDLVTPSGGGPGLGVAGED